MIASRGAVALFTIALSNGRYVVLFDTVPQPEYGYEKPKETRYGHRVQSRTPAND